MRLLLFISLLLLGCICTSTKNTTIKQNKLNGTWIPIKEEIGGKELPPVAFQKQKLVISDSNYTFTAESVDKGITKYTDQKMDIYGKEGVNTGKHFMAIYKYENEQLTICYNLLGDNYPEAFDTKGKSMYFLCLFKKEAMK
jgi:uncharacterized protein (TIGR03067 family)